MLNVLKAATFAGRKRKPAESANSVASAAELYRMAVKAIEFNQSFYLLDSLMAGLAKDCPASSSTEPGKIHAICSIDQGEGKSTVALALATALAHRAERDVLLVEADLRSPTLGTDLGRVERPGLEDFLRQQVSLEGAIQFTPVERLSILTAGGAGLAGGLMPATRLSLQETYHLLSRPFLRQALEGLRYRYSTILVDLPALSGGEAIPLMELLDGVVLVVKAGRSSKDRLERAVNLIGREKLVGVVLNNVRHSAPWWLRRILSEEEPA